MKKLIFSLSFLLCYSSILAQLDDTGSTSNGAMTIGNGTGTLYQFAGDQRGTDGTNQSQGGFGLLSGANQISPIIWMYGNGEKNAFQVIRKGYNATVQEGSVLFHVGANGRIGIDSNNPDEKFHVNGTTTITGDIGIIDDAIWKTGQHTLELQNSDAGDVVLAFHRAGYSSASIKHSTIGGLTLSGNGTFDSNHFFVKTDGNIGIGTTTPDAKLAVNGDVHAKEVKVDLNGWPDFVFKKDYTLPSLEEVETHIKANGHLKDIPSEAEVKANGINLGEMDAKLLQKIEELTLYTITQEKKIKELEKQAQEIQTLKKENEALKSLSERLAAIEKQLKSKN